MRYKGGLETRPDRVLQFAGRFCRRRFKSCEEGTAGAMLLTLAALPPPRPTFFFIPIKADALELDVFEVAEVSILDVTKLLVLTNLFDNTAVRVGDRPVFWWGAEIKFVTVLTSEIVGL